MKKVVLILMIFFLCGCEKEGVKTLVSDNDQSIVGINYPITGIGELDGEIKSYVNKVYDDFKSNLNDYNDRLELNIDYKFNMVNDKYYSVILKTFIYYSDSAHPTDEVMTFNYYGHKKIKLKDILQKNDIETYIKQQINNKYNDCLFDEYNINYDLFYLDDNMIHLYYNPYTISDGYCGIIDVEIPYTYSNITNDKQITYYDPLVTSSRTIDTNGKFVALTFDDGPSYYTNKIIDYLKEENVVATFFVLGNKVNTYTNTIRKMVSYGNEIGNHSYNHKLLTKLDDDDIKEQINKTQEIVKETTGYTPLLLRPTYGSVNSKLRSNVSLDIVLWNVDTLDWKIRNSKKIAARTIKYTHDNDIILMHDTKKRTYDALKIIIPSLKEKGFNFVTVSELKAIQAMRKYP